jgi:hypothetical protein
MTSPDLTKTTCAVQAGPPGQCPPEQIRVLRKTGWQAKCLGLQDNGQVEILGAYAIAGMLILGSKPVSRCYGLQGIRVHCYRLRSISTGSCF